MTLEETEFALLAKGIVRGADARVPYWTGRSNGKPQPEWSASRYERVAIRGVAPGRVLVQLRWGGMHITDPFACDVEELQPMNPALIAAFCPGGGGVRR